MIISSWYAIQQNSRNKKPLACLDLEHGLVDLSEINKFIDFDGYFRYLGSIFFDKWICQIDMTLNPVAGWHNEKNPKWSRIWIFMQLRF